MLRELSTTAVKHSFQGLSEGRPGCHIMTHKTYIYNKVLVGVRKRGEREEGCKRVNEDKRLSRSSVRISTPRKM